MNKYSKIKQYFKFSLPDNKRRSNEESMRAIIDDSSPFVVREAYKTARTNIIFSVSGMSKTGCKLIAITSANPGEGKTTSSLNLAITFAQTGARVLVVDGDLRKPRLHRYLGIKKDIGLSTVLANQVSIEKAIHKDIRPCLDALTAGEIPPNPAELLASDAMKALIAKLSQNYDYIFFDTPPVTVVTDASALSPSVDGIVIVVRQNYTDHESLSMAKNLLDIANAKILGFIVNDAQNKRGGYHYGRYRYKYGYRYAYKYGYKYDYQYGDLANHEDSEESESDK